MVALALFLAPTLFLFSVETNADREFPTEISPVLPLPRRIFKVHAGTHAHPHEYPYMAAIYARVSDTSMFTFICGGSIYNTDYILTAGHCLLTSDNFRILPEDIRVIVGHHEVDINIEQNSTKLFLVRNTIPHHGVDSSSRLFALNDIGLIQLEHPLKFDQDIQPLRVGSPADDVDGIGILSGWGKTGFYLPIQSPPEQTGVIGTMDLKSARLRIISNTLCSIRHFTFIPSRVMCAGPEGLLQRQSACFGDSGGPLACQGATGPYVCALVSTGTGCGLPFTPGFYTTVHEFITWIRIKAGKQ